MASLTSILSDFRKDAPDAPRRAGFALVLAVSGLTAPLAFALLPGGLATPFLIVAIGLAVGFTGLALLRERHADASGAVLVGGAGASGLWLTLADPAAIDAGLALAMITPLLAARLVRMHPLAVVAMLPALVVAIAQAAGMLILPAQLGVHAPVSALIALATVIAVASLPSRGRKRADADLDSGVRHLVERVRDGALRLAADGRLVFVTHSAETLLGCRSYELAGTGVLDRVHVLDRPAYMTALAAAQRDGRARIIEIRMRRDEPDAPARVPQFLWIEADFAPIGAPDLEGRRDVMLLLRDITGRRAEAEAAAAAALASEEASRAKSRFLATIGHELRTPLSAIVGFSDLLATGVGGELPAAQQEYARLISQSGRHMVDVVHMLLDMSRLEAGKFELATQSFDPANIVAPCLAIIEGSAAARRVDVSIDIAPRLPPMVADERACRQILINLLSNAIKFSAEGGSVSVGLRRQGKNIALSVSDRGIGMSAESVGRVGEPFFQVQDSLDRRSQGTGLGLSIVKGLVELHEGSLHVTSTPGEGTIITVLLPINGPAIKVEETGTVLPLHRVGGTQHMSTWRDGRRKAQ